MTPLVRMISCSAPEARTSDSPASFEALALTGDALAVLPQAVDHMTPGGNLPPRSREGAA